MQLCKVMICNLPILKKSRHKVLASAKLYLSKIYKIKLLSTADHSFDNITQQLEIIFPPRYCPVKDKKKIFFSWFLPPQTKHFRAKPVEYVEFLLGHQGRGSLISALKHKVRVIEFRFEGCIYVGGSLKFFPSYFIKLDKNELFCLCLWHKNIDSKFKIYLGSSNF